MYVFPIGLIVEMGLNSGLVLALINRISVEPQKETWYCVDWFDSSHKFIIHIYFIIFPLFFFSSQSKTASAACCICFRRWLSITLCAPLSAVSTRSRVTCFFPIRKIFKFLFSFVFFFSCSSDSNAMCMWWIVQFIRRTTWKLEGKLTIRLCSNCRFSLLYAGRPIQYQTNWFIQ